MKLYWGNLELGSVARHLQIVGQSSAMEPPDAPQRERRTVRVRLEFREDTYRQNYALVEQVRAALRTPTTQLKWQDDSNQVFTERWVTVTESEQPEAENRWGTYGQTLHFTFFYLVHNLTTNCLVATLQRQPSGPVKDLGAIFKWSETIEIEQLHDQRDPRKRVMARLAVSGELLGNTAASLDDCRDALLEQKNALVSEIVAGSAFEFIYGSGANRFRETVRLGSFAADVDQVRGVIPWRLTASFTKTPAEDDYAWLEYAVTTRETKSEGIISLGLRGRIGASSEARARTALAALYSGGGSLIPAGYVQVQDDITAHFVKSADGTAFTELLFELEWRDTTTLPFTATRSGENAVAHNLGVVERFADRYQAALADELRPHRRRAGGVLTAAGKIILPDTMTLAEKQAELVNRQAALDADLQTGASIRLQYGADGGVFDQWVRIADFTAEINRLRNRIEWSLQASYTKFPDEADYAVCDFKVGTREDDPEGTVRLTLTGRIAAPTAEAARARLARLRAAVIPAGYIRTGTDPVETSFSVESGRASGTDRGDGTTFIQLDFTEEWQKVDGDVLTHSLRVTHADDVKTGFVRTTYAGSVTARGATRDAAWVTAQTRAETLGAGKYPFLVQSTLTENDRLTQTSGGSVFVTVEFSYEYQRKGTRVYLEFAADRQRDAFGQTVETVSGFVAAPSFAEAQTAYQTDVRALYNASLLLSERAPTRAQQILRGVAQADHFDRYAFQLTVFVAKAAGETAMEVSVSTQPNLDTLELVSTVSGRIVAVNESVATQFLTTYLATLDLGTRQGTPVRKANFQTAPLVGGGSTTAFLGLEFTETYAQRLTGEAGVLECEVTEQLTHSGARWIEKPIPGGVSLFQHTGLVPGRRVVTGRVRGVTEVACREWAAKCRQLMITAAYEEAAQISTTFKFLRRTDGTARGDGANVLCFELGFTFAELLPEYPWA